MAAAVPTNVYLDLTARFNEGRLRAIISSGQAVVLHRLAMMSKDGDWIVREDDEATQRILGVLGAHGARYRFGAPFDVRWLRGGWSAHFEHEQSPLRVRSDFVSRPPRLSHDEVDRAFADEEGRSPPVLGVGALVRVKMTMREKDWPVIGELVRLLPSPRDQLTLSRSARDLIALGSDHPALVEELRERRPLLANLNLGRQATETALDAERRELMRADEERLRRYAAAASAWRAAWPVTERRIAGLPLDEAHELLVDAAIPLLPMELPKEDRESHV